MSRPRRPAAVVSFALLALVACSGSSGPGSRETWGDLAGDLVFASPDTDVAAADAPGVDAPVDASRDLAGPPDVADASGVDAPTGEAPAPPDTAAPDAWCGADTDWACVDDHTATRCRAGQRQSRFCGTDACQAGQCVCASVTQAATQTPLDMFIMMDRSYSMSHPSGTGLSKWQAVTEALQAFLTDPDSAGIAVGLQFFPIWFGAYDSCSPSDYAKAAVPIAALPGNAQAIVDAMLDHEPSNDTPTYAALKGALDFARSHALAHPSHSVVVVFATDGEPTECEPLDVPTIAGVAATAAAAAPAVRTFVVGVGDLPSLDAIAEAGDTTAAYHVDADGDVVVQFAAALQAIHGAALGCTYELPVPSDGSVLDLAKVNVQVTLAGAPALQLPWVATPGDCAPDGGCLFDDPVQPTRIVLCPQTCDAVTADPGAKVEVLLGCLRHTKDPQR